MTDTPPAPRFGDIVAARRTELGFSQSGCARALGLARSYWREIEQSNRGVANHATLQRIADVLRIDLDRLYLARHAVPPDVLAIFLTRPQLLTVVRTMAARLDAKDQETP